MTGMLAVVITSLYFSVVVTDENFIEEVARWDGWTYRVRLLPLPIYFPVYIDSNLARASIDYSAIKRQAQLEEEMDVDQLEGRPSSEYALTEAS